MKDKKDLNVLNNIRSLKKALRLMSISDIDKFEKNLKKAKEEIMEEKETEAKNEILRKEKINQIIENIQSSGLTVDEVFETASKTSVKKSKKPVKAKYALRTENGTLEWSGRGKTPVLMQQYIDNGGSLEELLIDSEN